MLSGTLARHPRHDHVTGAGEDVDPLPHLSANCLRCTSPARVSGRASLRRMPRGRYFFLMPSSCSFFTITSPAVPVVGDLSMARIFPSGPM